MLAKPMCLASAHTASVATLVLLTLAALPLWAESGSASPQATAATPTPAAPATDWVYPLIKGYGGVHPRPELPVRPSPSLDYKIIVDVTHGGTDHDKVFGSLVRLARLVNVMAYTGVPREHVHIVAVIENEAGFAAFSNAAYRKQFHIDNPNLALLHELKQSGVELMVCSQALAENGFEDSDIAPDVEVTLSALTDFAVYGERGYSYLQL